MTDTSAAGDKERQAFHIYVDESSKAETYFGVGAVFCRSDAAEELKGFIVDAVVRDGHEPNKEIHWKGVPGHLVPLYSEVGTQLIAWTKPPSQKYLTTR